MIQEKKLETALHSAIAAQTAVPTRPAATARAAASARAAARPLARPLPVYAPAFPAAEARPGRRYERTTLGLVLMLALLVGLLLTARNAPAAPPYLSMPVDQSSLLAPAITTPAGPADLLALPARAPVCLPVTGD